MPAASSPDLVALVSENVARVRERVAAAARAAGRDPHDVRLLVATKTQPAQAVRAVVEAGVDLVGENRVQELVAKAPDVADLVAAGRVDVHMIGHLQRNKVNPVLAAATGVQSVDSLALAQALSTRCARDGRVLDVMVQVNVSAEASKSGTGPDDAPHLARDVAALPGLRLAGFMTIGAHSPDEALVRAGFARLREVRDAVVRSGEPGTEDAHGLSMGMSGDLELAVAEGATVVRVGTAVFGPRPA
ncbi:YggS family pyridoxal phosphate-dependent enzyme [Cellulosimicrobium marinum]|uniref:YggS family pyridoxal phosphate-dependent enzyme n=1 Tax=Cellulosimicrobium marinum TaxID=1638992 RepID=UPI001E4556AC|nr:YggS family pyridoxal phosphate-dependent enzyme [Cellulosimicrobium marinum]MCB7137890.1 YggS family pyridoxal phosphate-dependent enzyme [Cellulosimicrobium marinum]